MEHARIPTSEQLMAEMAWVRKLARALVRDAALADDVAQETWIVATERQPETDRPLRPWLARVVVNLVRTRRRSEARRDERDAAYDAGRTVPTPEELVEKVALQRAVADEVLALVEPYRSTVLLHFVEGHTSAEIARRLGIPDGTVRRRLKVGLDQLREALRKRTDQPRHGWIAALVPFSRSSGPTPASAAMGALAMKKVIGIVVLVLLLLLVGGGLVWRHKAGRAGATSAGQGGGGTGHGSTSGTGTGGSVGGDADSAQTSTVPSWLVQTGAPSRRIAGRVVAHGVPVAGAKVVLAIPVIGEPRSGFVLDSSGVIPQRIAEVTSAADGRFDFGPQPPAMFTVSAAAPQHAAGSVGVANGNPRINPAELVVELGDCVARLSGTIADSSGGPIAHARISAIGFTGTESDATGAYSLCLSPQRAFGMPSAQVRVGADGYGTIKANILVVGDLRQDFQLAPEAVIVGRVTTKDGKPVAGARVVAAADVLDGLAYVASGWTLSDRDGRFKIDGLAASTFQLTASAQGLGMTTPMFTVARPTTTSREIDLVLDALARVRGHMVSNGAPVVGASVMAVHDRALGVNAITQADGSFTLEGVPYGAARLFAPPYRVTSPAELQVDAAVVDGVQIEVTKLATLRGRVTRRGEPAAGADVLYIDPPQALIVGPPGGAKADANGVFELEGVPPGPAQLAVWTAKAFTFKNIDVVANTDTTVDIELEYAGEVTGTVVDESGAPVAGVLVQMDIVEGNPDMCESVTDAKGQFDCSQLTGGMYRPIVMPLPGGRQGFAPATGEQFEPIRVPKDAATTGVTLAIKHERLAIRGTVVDDTGSPVPDVRVEAFGRGGDLTMGPPSTMSDASGRFTIANLARGTYQLHARAGDGSESEPLEVEAGANAASVVLARAGAIEGTLAGFATRPTVEIDSIDRGPLVRIALVEGTKFSKGGLRPGRYTVQATAGASVDGQSVDVRAGETVHVALSSRGTGRVEGTVTELGTKTPVAGMRCDAKLVMDGQTSIAPPDTAQQAFTDAAGRFVVDAPVGRARIVCFVPTGGLLSPAGGDVDVAAGAIAKLDVSSVRAKPSGAPANAGFAFVPFVLPVTVGFMVPNGPGAAAGIRPGDHILAIDGTSTQGLLPEGAAVLLMNHRAKTPLTLAIERAGTAQTIKLVLP